LGTNEKTRPEHVTETTDPNSNDDTFSTAEDASSRAPSDLTSGNDGSSSNKKDCIPERE